MAFGDQGQRNESDDVGLAMNDLLDVVNYPVEKPGERES